MKGRPLTDDQISRALRARVPERTQPGLRDRIIEATEATAQQRRSPASVGRALALVGLQDSTDGGRMNRGAWLLVAAALLTLLAVSAVIVGSQRPSLLATLPTPSSSSTPTPSPSPTRSPEVSPSPTALSLELAWTKVPLDGRLGQIAWLGDRFVLVDGESGAVSTSTDGADWQVLQPGDPDPGYAELLRGSFVSWQDEVVGWWNPEDGPDYTNKPPVTARDVVQIIRPPSPPTDTTPFRGRIESIGIGPKGIVAQVHSHLDWDAWVASKLGDDWVARYEEVSFKDGILKITMKQGRGLNVVWAEQGLELGDFQDAGFGWYSPDGEQWTPMPVPTWSPDADSGNGFVTGFGDVVGVSDGFIARGVDTECASPDGCAGMWHSSDGLDWRNIGNVPYRLDRVMLPWLGGALVTDGVGSFDLWTADGGSELPMTAGLPTGWKAQASEQLEPSVAIGPLGLVTVVKGNPEILVTRDGVDWDIRPMPTEMLADYTQLDGTPDVAVGNRSVLVVMWSGTDREQIPSLWLGAIEP